MRTSKFQFACAMLMSMIMASTCQVFGQSPYKRALEILEHCESVFVASYLGYEKSEEITWNKPPIANFKIEEFLKGPPFGGYMPIRFAFHDNKNENPPQDWKFNPTMMPKKGSKWIIALPEAVPVNRAFDTYNGSAGIIEATDENYIPFDREVRKSLRISAERYDRQNREERIRKMFLESESITVCEYVGYEIRGTEIRWKNPPCAKFRPVDYIKGPPCATNLPVRFEFHDGTRESTPPNWEFTESMMPAKGSKWIIAVKSMAPREGMFDTYQGSFGRLEANDENLRLMNQAVELMKR